MNSFSSEDLADVVQVCDSTQFIANELELMSALARSGFRCSGGLEGLQQFISESIEVQVGKLEHQAVFTISHPTSASAMLHSPAFYRQRLTPRSAACGSPSFMMLHRAGSTATRNNITTPPLSSRAHTSLSIDHGTPPYAVAPSTAATDLHAAPSSHNKSKRSIVFGGRRSTTTIANGMLRATHARPRSGSAEFADGHHLPTGMESSLLNAAGGGGSSPLSTAVPPSIVSQHFREVRGGLDPLHISLPLNTSAFLQLVLLLNELLLEQESKSNVRRRAGSSFQPAEEDHDVGQGRADGGGDVVSDEDDHRLAVAFSAPPFYGVGNGGGGSHSPSSALATFSATDGHSSLAQQRAFAQLQEEVSHLSPEARSRKLRALSDQLEDERRLLAQVVATELQDGAVPLTHGQEASDGIGSPEASLRDSVVHSPASTRGRTDSVVTTGLLEDGDENFYAKKKSKKPPVTDPLQWQFDICAVAVSRWADGGVPTTPWAVALLQPITLDASISSGGGSRRTSARGLGSSMAAFAATPTSTLEERRVVTKMLYDYQLDAFQLLFQYRRETDSQCHRFCNRALLHRVLFPEEQGPLDWPRIVAELRGEVPSGPGTGRRHSSMRRLSRGNGGGGVVGSAAAAEGPNHVTKDGLLRNHNNNNSGSDCTDSDRGGSSDDEEEEEMEDHSGTRSGTTGSIRGDRSATYAGDATMTTLHLDGVEAAMHQPPYHHGPRSRSRSSSVRGLSGPPSSTGVTPSALDLIESAIDTAVLTVTSTYREADALTTGETTTTAQQQQQQRLSAVVPPAPRWVPPTDFDVQQLLPFLPPPATFSVAQFLEWLLTRQVSSLQRLEQAVQLLGTGGGSVGGLLDHATHASLMSHDYGSPQPLLRRMQSRRGAAPSTSASSNVGASSPLLGHAAHRRPNPQPNQPLHNTPFLRGSAGVGATNTVLARTPREMNSGVGESSSNSLGMSDVAPDHPLLLALDEVCATAQQNISRFRSVVPFELQFPYATTVTAPDHAQVTTDVDVMIDDICQSYKESKVFRVGQRLKELRFLRINRTKPGFVQGEDVGGGGSRKKHTTGDVKSRSRNLADRRRNHHHHHRPDSTEPPSITWDRGGSTPAPSPVPQAPHDDLREAVPAAVLFPVRAEVQAVPPAAPTAHHDDDDDEEIVIDENDLSTHDQPEFSIATGDGDSGPAASAEPSFSCAADTGSAVTSDEEGADKGATTLAKRSERDKAIAAQKEANLMSFWLTGNRKEDTTSQVEATAINRPRQNPTTTRGASRKPRGGLVDRLRRSV